MSVLDARRRLLADAAYLALAYPEQVLVLALALDGGWSPAAPRTLLTKYGGGHALTGEEMAASRDECVAVGLLCLYETPAGAHVHLWRYGPALGGAAIPPCPVHPAKPLAGAPRRRPANVNVDHWETYCREQIALVLAQVPTDPLVAQWRTFAAAKRPPGQILGGDLADMQALLRLHTEGLDWRHGLQAALKKGACAFGYVEAAARDRGHRPHAAPPVLPSRQPVRVVPLDHPLVIQERQMIARAQEAARAAYATGTPPKPAEGQ